MCEVKKDQIIWVEAADVKYSVEYKKPGKVSDPLKTKNELV